MVSFSYRTLHHAALWHPESIGRNGFVPYLQHPVVGADYQTRLPLRSPVGPLACGCCDLKYSNIQQPAALVLNPVIHSDPNTSVCKVRH